MATETQKGLTLLEVLVALVILAVALTAIIKATTENIRATAYLQEKTQATWVALNVLNQARLSLQTFPQAPEHRSVKETWLGQPWEWQANRVLTPNPRIQEVHVTVFHPPDAQAVTELTGYLYVH